MYHQYREYHQYRDLPQIPSFSDDTAYAQWNDQDVPYGGACSPKVPSMSNMERYLADQSFISQNLLQPAAAHIGHNQSQHYQQFNGLPVHQLRYVSPDNTSISGNSSYATSNGVHSPHHTHSYGSPDDFSQNPLPYPNGEPHVHNVSTAGGSISLRDIEYQHEPESEALQEEVEVIDTKAFSPFPQETTLLNPGKPDNSHTNDSLRDAESVEPMMKEEESSSDADYIPSRTTRRRRSSASNSGSSKQGQRRASQHSRKHSSSKSGSSSGRVKKKSNRTIASVHAGKTYTESQFPGDLQRHFPCPLSAYGCRSNFSSKNEWKRHVSTQHIKLGFWRCDLCAPTVDSHDEQTVYHNDFNRKDLFTQHLRRMHAASHSSSRNQKEHRVVTESNISDHQTRCFNVLRETPPQSKCLFCPETFSGPASWDLRMEHVGRHLEKDRKTSGLQHTDIEYWIADPDLEQWLYQEGIITLLNGQWTIGDGQPKRTPMNT